MKYIENTSGPITRMCRGSDGGCHCFSHIAESWANAAYLCHDPGQEVKYDGYCRKVGQKVVHINGVGIGFMSMPPKVKINGCTGVACQDDILCGIKWRHMKQTLR
eukprot:gnl/MRDRNA2_/MRDRNA2_291646_c0_seq1.p1 gnl/MRDRNA2_/MRDRNA2_291646_c0~~gnl/MRDRNA2_/MRDRNA2_291646_c0_seq1.p1  ORF type:complete len:105 (+),score=2.72 gnl/MRDRNA2_/MRDRNA2_291646_c0_seq1:234-548(+)